MTKWHIIENVIAAIVVAGGLGWIFWRTLKQSFDPVNLIVRWVVSIVVMGSALKTALPMIRHGGEIPVIAGVLVITAGAIVVALFWAPAWASILFQPITSLFDGGNEEPELKPLYSSAEAKRGKGLYHEAVQDIRRQLEMFPNDFTGHMLLGQIQAEHLNDLQGAQITIHKVINQTRLAPANLAGALHQLADWHLKIGKDRDSAEEALNEIIQRLPDTQFSQTAAQRIAHLPSTEKLLDDTEPERVRIQQYEKYVGLKTSGNTESSEENPAQTASEYVKHLEKHPLDSNVREKLAVIYAEHYKRVDMAQRELDTLISSPSQPAKQVVRWLNLLADLQIRIGNDLPGARSTLHRIEVMFPKSAHAQQANTRLAYLPMESRRHEAQHTVKLGTYEKDLGLKKNPNA